MMPHLRAGALESGAPTALPGSGARQGGNSLGGEQPARIPVTDQ